MASSVFMATYCQPRTCTRPVYLESGLTHSSPRKVALYRLPEELVARHREAAEDEEGAGPAVEQPEGPVVDGRLPLSYLDNTTAQLRSVQYLPRLSISYQQFGGRGGSGEDCGGHHCHCSEFYCCQMLVGLATFIPSLSTAQLSSVSCSLLSPPASPLPPLPPPTQYCSLPDWTVK